MNSNGNERQGDGRGRLPSRRAAERAGLTRLTDGTRGRRGAPQDRRFAEGLRTPPRQFMVVARDAAELYASLKETFADSDGVEVILDRRFGERRERSVPVPADRRRGERRFRPPLTNSANTTRVSR